MNLCDYFRSLWVELVGLKNPVTIPENLASGFHLYECKRCSRNEIDCRNNGCVKSPCPMEYVGDRLYDIPLDSVLSPHPVWMKE